MFGIDIEQQYIEDKMSARNFGYVSSDEQK